MGQATAPMNLQQIQCAFFTSIRGRSGQNRPILDVLADIKSDRWREEINRLRTLSGEDYDKAKKSLPAFLASSRTLTGSHAGKDLGEHTGLLQIDIDKLVSAAEAQRVKEILAADYHVLACWISPGGKGVKALVSIVASHDSHKACFEAASLHFRQILGQEIDASCCDASRLCFVSHDPDLVLKLQADAFMPLEGIHKAEASSSVPIPSTPSLHSRSYVLHPLSSVLHNITWSDYPALGPFYQNLVVERLGNVQPGMRNCALVEMVPVLYSAVAPKFVLLFAQRFYELNNGKFRDPLEQHMKEAQTLLDGVAANYPHERLTSQEAAVYRRYDERMQAAFRICHALSKVQHKDCLPPCFFLSAEKLGYRLGIFTSQADRLLKQLCNDGVLKMTIKGLQRVKGQQLRASRYMWLLPSQGARPM